MTEEEPNQILPWMTKEEVKAKQLVPWKRIGNYLHEHPQGSEDSSP